jgi:hypothetical protein
MMRKVTNNLRKKVREEGIWGRKSMYLPNRRQAHSFRVSQFQHKKKTGWGKAEREKQDAVALEGSTHEAQ